MPLKLVKALPGKKAQREMAPEHRLKDLDASIPGGALESAVLVALLPKNGGSSPETLLDWTVLLTRRNSYPGVHSGQISFPGGRCEHYDADAWGTACRESAEEVGLGESHLELVCPLTSVYVPPSNFVMHPFIAVREPGQRLRNDPHEVVDRKEIPLRVLNPAKAVNLEFTDMKGTTVSAPAWEYGGYTIWGATAMVLAELYRLIETEALVQH